MKALKVFYNPNQTAKKNTGFSPSAIKPALVLQSWTDQGLAIDVCDFKPLKAKHIAMAHNESYVRGVLACEERNGFGNTLKEVADTLPWTTGSMVAAVAHALRTGEPAASLTSGFHHAGYFHGGGFCTFNGLMIASVMALRFGKAKKIGIVDIDCHYGDGTEDIISYLDLKNQVKHYTYGGDRRDAKTWLRDLPGIISSFSECDVILFQAGADPHIEDPLGGRLTSEQLRERDRIVFETARSIGVPVAWNLAGGYQKPIDKVVQIHDTTAIECLRVYADVRLHESA